MITEGHTRFADLFGCRLLVKVFTRLPLLVDRPTWYVSFNAEPLLGGIPCRISLSKICRSHLLDFPIEDAMLLASEEIEKFDQIGYFGDD